MAVHREARGLYLIEASAFHLPTSSDIAGGKWQPRLTLTRLACENQLQRSLSFPGLHPVFETAKGATRFATDLGRSMVDEGSPRLKV